MADYYKDFWAKMVEIWAQIWTVGTWRSQVSSDFIAKKAIKYFFF